ncbi:DUF1403 family protein [Pseudochrobactrum kiredjianiae]|uniref:DUF1403 family protein n=1 Tax=Pseudochrobactrum kiredjianiae TaxID=386305 RepID=A0ABW3UZW1_9HYPH|nr:DUF1403 family protein [Pseudochrobactrum kiredjianiae]MDM7852448.1 DUF1403 family protein [Pseudochrobactrum kiredjianiae]
MKNQQQIHTAALDGGSPRLPPAYTVPAWARPQASGDSLESAVFSAAIAMKCLDDLVCSDPVWLGCWRSHQALLCANATCQWLRLKADEHSLRDAVLLCEQSGDPGPAGRVLQIYQKLSRRTPVLSSKTVATLTQALGLQPLCDADLASLVEVMETTLQGRQPPLLAAAALITSFFRLRPDGEILGWILADIVLAAKLGWRAPVPLLFRARLGPAMRLSQGKGQLKPDDADFIRAFCLATCEASQQALNSATTIARRAETLLAVAPKLRSKGAQTIIKKLLEEDSILATAPDSGLSRWAAARLFTRLEDFGAVREVSGRSSFKIYGL